MNTDQSPMHKRTRNTQRAQSITDDTSSDSSHDTTTVDTREALVPRGQSSSIVDADGDGSYAAKRRIPSTGEPSSSSVRAKRKVTVVGLPEVKTRTRKQKEPERSRYASEEVTDEIGGQCHRFFFTWNNYPSDWEDRIEDVFETKKQRSTEAFFTYICGAPEVGEKGTPHIQGYMELSGKAKTATVHNKVRPFGLYLGLGYANGSGMENRTYCKGPYSKDGKVKPINDEFIELGRLTNQGQRTDFQLMRDAVNNGADIQEVIQLASNPQVMSSGLKMITYRRAVRRPPPKVIVFYGVSGSGKTHNAIAALEEAGYDYWVSSFSKGSIFFNGYEGQKAVIFDDIREDTFSFNRLLTLLDGTPQKVDIKGGCVNWVPEIVYITSPFHPKELFENNRKQDNVMQLIRRIDIICEFDTPHVSVKLPKVISWKDAHRILEEDVPETCSFNDLKYMKKHERRNVSLSSDEIEETD